MRHLTVMLATGAMLAPPIAAVATTYAADPVLFQGVFGPPQVDAGALRSATGARFMATLNVVNNSREPIRLSKAATVTPELVGLRGEAEPTTGAATPARAVRPGVVTLEAGGSQTLAVSGRLRLADGELRWRGDDGSAVGWKLAPGRRYSLRLRYQADDAAAWRGVGLTHAVALPID